MKFLFGTQWSIRMFKHIGYLLGILYILCIIVYWFGLGGDDAIFWRNTVYLLPPLVAVCAGMTTLYEFGLSGTRAKTLIYLMFGLVCWLVGEILFFSYAVIFHTDPFPSLADVFYLIGYLGFFIALLNEIRTSSIKVNTVAPSVLFLFAIASFAFALGFAYFGIYLAYNPIESLMANIISISYGVGDLILLLTSMMMLILAWEYRGGRLSRMWTLLFFSFLMMLCGDILYAIHTVAYTSEVWLYKSLIDTFFMGSYLLFAWGLFDFGFSLKETKKHISEGFVG